MPTIYDALKANGLTSAGILWPVTAKSSITYNLPEVVAINGENQALKVLKNGSPLFCLGLELKYGRIREGTSQPYLDDTKHAYGTKGQAVDNVIERMDKRLRRYHQSRRRGRYNGRDCVHCVRRSRSI
ncbi:MAG TPA: hypothetical protein GXZ58_03805 [Bacilli bacterium]|nr:hypothetical protein [Bacilli bacterium]